MAALPTSLVTALADRYRLERELGQGGMATVYLGYDLRQDRSVALKVLLPELSDLLGRERFLREIAIASHLQHVNILPLFESGSAGQFLYYVMPYVEGETLRDRLDREKQLGLEDTLAIAREVADALAYAHSRGVVHRDIKPGNILLSGGHAIVADFGIAHAIREIDHTQLTARGIAIGTPSYISPEQATAQQVDARSDIYSLGCVVYEMLAGEPPFSGRTAQAIIARHLQEPPPSIRVVRPTVPPATQAAIERALAKVPADRFTSALAFSDALLTTRERRARAPWRSHAMAIATGSVVVIAMIVFGASQWFGGSAPPALDPTHIAVLFFEDLSEGARLGHVAAGLTEDLIDELSQVPTLHVISPDGVRPFRGKPAPLDTIAAKFHAGTIVTGSVTQSRERLRVLVRVTDPGTGIVILSQAIERERGDLLDLQREVVQEVGRALRHRVGRVLEFQERRAGTTSAAAWELVERAEALREAADEITDPVAAGRTLLQADSLLALAERRDPAWSEPVVLRGWLAYEQAGVPMAGHPTPGVSAGRTTAEWIRTGLAEADRALRLNPGDPAALELRGTILYRTYWLTPAKTFPDLPDPLAGAERDLRAAAGIPFRSQARAWSTLGTVLEVAGRYAESGQAAEKAYAADAFLRNSSENVFRLYKTALELERPGEARRWCEQGLREYPTNWYFPFCRLQMLGWPLGPEGSSRDAWQAVEQLRRAAAPDEWAWLRPRVEMMAAAALARSGLSDSAERVLRRARAAAPEDTQLLYYEAVARVRLGQTDSALELLAASVRTSSEDKARLLHHSLLRPLWNHPRFLAIMLNKGRSQP